MLALLLQAGFLLLLFQSVHLLTSRPQAARELIFTLPRLRPLPAAAAPPRQETVPSIAVPRPIELPAPPPAIAPDAGALRGLGQSLFGCAPENYANLTPEQRGHCPKPGERAQRSDEDELLNPRSHSRDAKLWQEGIDERNWMPMECLGAMPSVAFCLADASRQERLRAEDVYSHIERDHARAAASAPLPKPDIPVRHGR